MRPPASSNSKAPLIALAFAAIIFSAFLFLSVEPEAPPAQLKSESPKAAATTASASPTISFAPRQGETPAPAPTGTTGASSGIPENTPVREVLQRLDGAAASGNVNAACRLGMEKLRCLRVQQATDARVVADPAARLDKELCRDVPPEQARDAWKFLWQAANSGSVAAMSLFVRDPGLSYAQPTEAAEGWLVYRDNAHRLLDQAVQSGDVMALWYSWYSAATGLSSGGERVFEKDPYRAIVFGSAVMPLLDERRRRMVQTLNTRLTKDVTQDQAGKAAAEGEALRARHFVASAPLPASASDDAYLAPADCEKAPLAAVPQKR
jgi:hypothetical protein